MIPVPSGVRVWLATGATDIRRGMNGLALQVQEGLGRDPHAGDLYVFRGRRGDLIKVLWHDGLGMSLYAKRLERGPVSVAITRRRRGAGHRGSARLSARRHRLAPPAADLSAGGRRIGVPKRAWLWLNRSVSQNAALASDEVAAFAALAAEQSARREAEARASGAEAMVAHLKLLIAKLRQDRFGASSERGRKLLDQMELELEELEAAASEDAAQVEAAEQGIVSGFTRRRPVRGPLPEHLPRERVVVPGPTACPCCGGTLAKLGESITETLEVVPR